jgi:hypothetical protein
LLTNVGPTRRSRVNGAVDESTLSGSFEKDHSMKSNVRWAVILTLATHGTNARAQYGWGGWGGYGGGAETPGGSLARGMGAYAAGAGQYNLDTSQARSINANTAMRFNEYMYLSTQNETAKHHALLKAQSSNINKMQSEIQDRLRNHPDRHDIETGDALNVAAEEIEDPRVYYQSLTRAKIKIGGELIRDIPFRYAPAGVTATVHQIVGGPPPAALTTGAFDDERAAIKDLAKELRKNIEEGETPNPATVKKALAIVDAAIAKAGTALEPGTKERNEVERYLKSVRGLLNMLQTPALNLLLSDVGKHPEATLADLLGFMSAYNLRFGLAKTEPQRAAYNQLYPMLIRLRDETAPALASSPPLKGDPAAVGEFFSGMSNAKSKVAPPQPGQ